MLTARINVGGLRLRSLDPAVPSVDRDSELEFRSAVLRLGPWLGWAAIAAVFAGLALGRAPHLALLLSLTLAAAALNTAAMFVPWQEWHQDRVCSLRRACGPRD